MEKIKEKFKSSPELLSLIMFILCGSVIVFLTNNLFSVFAPFVIAYVATRILRPIMVWLKRVFKIPNIINTLFCMCLLSAAAVAIAWLFCHYIVEGISYLIDYLSQQSTIDSLISFAGEVGIKLEAFTDVIGVEIRMEDITSVVKDFATKLITVLSDFSLTFAAQIPGLLMSLVIGCVAAFYMLFDYDRIAHVANQHMSPKVKQVVHTLNHDVLTSFIRMVLAYVLISAICFVELLVGFYILGITDAAFIALITAVLDVLPILGSGAVLVPWGIISILMGNPFVGIGLLVLWGVIVVVRQIVEPRIVGSQIGIHPLATLIALYVGLQLMGGLGLIVGPLYVIACKKLNDAGVFHIYPKVDKLVKNKNKSKTKEQNSDKKEEA